jgi:hypothetical protein
MSWLTSFSCEAKISGGTVYCNFLKSDLKDVGSHTRIALFSRLLRIMAKLFLKDSSLGFDTIYFPT